MWTFKILPLSNFHIHNTVSLTIVTKLYIMSPELTYLITGRLCRLTTFTHFSHPWPSTSANHQSVLSTYIFDSNSHFTNSS